MGLLSRARQGAFQWIHGRNLVYNTCWEDPRLDRAALGLQPDSTVAVITSAGCNVLDYLLDEPRRVHAIDVNPRQNALLELKIAAIRAWDQATFFRWFGTGNAVDHSSAYQRDLRPQLSAWSRAYWDRNIRFFRGGSNNDSFYFHGTSGFFARMINWYIDHGVKLRGQIDTLLQTRDPLEQRACYEETVKPAFWNRPLAWFLRRNSTMSLLGVPPAQQQHVALHYGCVANFIQGCLDAVFGILPLHDNYFWRVYLTGCYTAECAPEYLKAENFTRLKQLVDRVRIHTTTVEQFLRTSESPVTHLVLLDHQDWLASERRDLLQAEWQAIVERAAPDARLLWRSGGLDTPFVDEQVVLVRNGRYRVGDLLQYNQSLADELHVRDRVHTYGCFRIADLAV